MHRDQLPINEPVTYVDDLVRTIRLLIDDVSERPADGIVQEGDSLSPALPFRIINIGNSNKVRLLGFIDKRSASGRRQTLGPLSGLAAHCCNLVSPLGRPPNVSTTPIRSESLK